MRHYTTLLLLAVFTIGAQPVFSDPEDYDLQRDYATIIWGEPWDFEDGTTAGIVSFGKGLRDVKVADGILTFSTGETNNYFYWGEAENKDWRPHARNWNIREEKIGVGWNAWDEWAVLVRLRQSLPVATWTVTAKRIRGAGVNRTVEIKGTNWQTVVFDIPYQSIGLAKYCINALTIGTREAGNRVEIEEVLVVPKKLEKEYLRKTLELPASVYSARLCVRSRPAFNLYVNGRKVFDHEGIAVNSVCDLDLAEYLAPGRNVIALERESAQGRGIVEGYIWCSDGTAIPLLPDSSWKSARVAIPGWTGKDLDDRAWQDVKPADERSFAERWRGRLARKSERYVGPIEAVPVGSMAPIFTSAEKYGFRIRIPRGCAKKPSITYVVRDYDSAKQVASGTLDKFSPQAGALETTLECAIKEPAVYVLGLQLRDGADIIDERLIETAVVGKIPQKELAYGADYNDELKLKLIDSIECGNPADTHELYSVPASVIKDTEWGACRQTGEGKPYAWFSYRIKTGTAGRPHLVVVEYPGDRKTTFGCQVNEQGSGRAVSGAYTGNPYPLDNRLHELKFIYYPTDADIVTVVISNYGRDQDTPPRIKSIRIFEVTGDLPAVKIPHPADRIMGIHNERVGCQRLTFGWNGDHNSEYRDAIGSYKVWWDAIVNQIKYLRFTGQNMYFMVVYMYDWPSFPSSRFFPAGGGGSYERDFVPLFARMFEANGMSLILGVEYFGTQQLWNKFVYTDQEVRQGAPTLFQVDKEGRQSAWNWVGPVGNYSRPEIQKPLLELTDELVRRYGSYKAVRGFGFITDVAGWAPAVFWKSSGKYVPLEYSYDDFSIRKFERDTGLKTGIPEQDPLRFNKRFQMLTSNPEMRKKWVDWRAGELIAFNKTIAEKIGRIGKNYYLFQKGDGNLERYVTENEPFDLIYRDQGYDIARYKDIPNLMLCSSFTENGTRTLRNRRYRGADYPYEAAYNSLKSPELHRLFDNGDQGGTYVGLEFYEPLLSGQPKPTANWYDHGASIGYAWAEEPHILDSFVTRLFYSTPRVVAHTWCDTLIPAGCEESFRRFGAAFQSIPEGIYSNLTGNGMDKNIIVRQATSGKEVYAYLVNPRWWKAECRIELTAKTVGTDLLTDARLASGKTIPLLPYEVRPFKLTGPEAGFRALTCLPSGEARSYVENLLYIKQLKLYQSGASGASDSAKASDQLVKTLSQCEQLITEGDYDRALVLLEDWRLVETAGDATSQVWRYAGPIAAGGKNLIDQVLAPETAALTGSFDQKHEIEGTGIVRWKKIRVYQNDEKAETQGFSLLKHDFHQREPFLAYFAGSIGAEKAGPMRLIVKKITPKSVCRVWVNGTAAREVARSDSGDEATYEISLKEGFNPLLLKVQQAPGEVRIYLKIVNPQGKPMLYKIGGDIS